MKLMKLTKEIPPITGNMVILSRHWPSLVRQIVFLKGQGVMPQKYEIAIDRRFKSYMVKKRDECT